MNIPIDKEAFGLLSIKERLTSLENSLKFTEVKLHKIELAIKNTSAGYILPDKREVTAENFVCKRCTKIDAHYGGLIESMRKKMEKIQALKEKDEQESRFLFKRVVAIYGNKGLLDLMNHIENPSLTEERKAQYMQIKPHL